MKKALPVVALLLLTLVAFAADVPKPDLQRLDELAPQLCEQWNLPGIAVGVVQGGNVVFAKGYGYRDLEHKLPVTTKTLFPIGSVSKSFTALSLAILNDRGKVQWDTPVRRYLPTFELSDPVAAQRTTIRDLMSHRTGLARHDLLWYSSSFTRKEMFDRLRYLEMGKGFRSGYDYNNLMVMTAGYLAGEVSRLGWEDLVRQTIFDPVAMKSTNFTLADSQKSPDYALPYTEVKGAIKRIPFKPAQEIGPAGGINSNLDDMLRYTIMLLAKGKYADKRIVSESNLKEIQSPQTVMSASPRFAELGYASYGMGWVIQSYRGHPYVWHNGGIDGFYTLVGLLPSDNIGLVVLSNRLGHSASEILAYNIFDRVLGLDEVPWGDRFKAFQENAKQAEAEELKQVWADRKTGTHPAHDLKDYSGKYDNPGYGTVTVMVEDGKLSVALNDLKSPLEHYHYEVFITPDTDNPLALTKMRFNTGNDGAVEGVAIPLQPGMADILFNRVVEKAKAPAGQD